jgi:hypothetical protein
MHWSSRECPPRRRGIAGRASGYAYSGRRCVVSRWSIAVDLAARLIYCKELGVIEIINPFTEKREIVEKIRSLISRLEEKEGAIQRNLY